MRYLVDSDWIIDALADTPEALATLNRLSNDGLAVSIITLGELFEGAYLSADTEGDLITIRQFLSGYQVLSLSDAVMDVFARTRAYLRRQGNLIPDMDLLIGSTAITFNLILMTRNVRHFERIPDLVLYKPQMQQP